jgi:hypothetical protein
MGNDQDDWTSARGRFAAIRHAGRPLQMGFVEEVTPDGRMLWLAANGVNTRVLIDKADGYEIAETWVSALREVHGYSPAIVSGGRSP